MNEKEWNDLDLRSLWQANLDLHRIIIPNQPYKKYNLTKDIIVTDTFFGTERDNYLGDMLIMEFYE